MSDYKEKPKRQFYQERPFLYLAVGILIGIFVAAIGFVAFFMIAGSETQVVLESSPIYALPTQIPVSGQGVVQPESTVVAPRNQSAKISPNGNYLALISVENGVSTIFLNSLEHEDSIISNNFVLYGEQGYYNAAIFSPDGRYLMVTIEQFTGPAAALLFDVQTREIIDQFPEIHAAAFSPNSENLVLVSASTGIRVVDTASRTLIASLQLDANMIQSVDYNSNNQIALASGDEVLVYNVQNLDVPPAVIVNNKGFIYDVAFHPDGEQLAIAGDSFVQIVNIPAGARTEYSFDSRQIFTVQFSDDGEWLAIGGGDSGIGEARLTVFRWNISDVIQPDPNYYEPITLTGHHHVVTDVAFTPDGNLLSASWDGTVRLWDLETQREISQIGY